MEGRFIRYSRAAAIILVILSWIWSFLMALPPFLGWGTFSIEDNGMSCAPTWRDPKDFPYNIYLFTAGFFFPLFIIIMTGFRILFIVQKHMNGIQDETLKEGAKRKEKKIFSMIVLMVSVYVFCWGPYAVLCMIGVLGYGESVPLYMTVFPLQFAKSAILWNPIIYVVMNKAFQKAFITWLPFELGTKVGQVLGNSRGPLSNTDIGRRQHPRFFARLWKEKSKTDENLSKYQASGASGFCEEKCMIEDTGSPAKKNSEVLEEDL